MKSLHDINSFYVGELHIQNKFNNIGFPINIDEQFSKIKEVYNYKKNDQYKLFISVFYKIDDSTYLCLHNNKEYKLDGDSFCKNMTPIKKVLPQVSYEIPNLITIKNALNLFDTLYNKNGILYDNNLYDKKDLWIGNFRLCKGFTKTMPTYKLHQYTDLVYNILLLQNESTFNESTLGICGGDNKIYNYVVYNCLLLKRNNNVLNLQNNKFYPMSSNLKTFNPEIIGESYFYLESNFEELYGKGKITIPKSFTLLKEYNSNKYKDY